MVAAKSSNATWGMGGGGHGSSKVGEVAVHGEFLWGGVVCGGIYAEAQMVGNHGHTTAL